MDRSAAHPMLFDIDIDDDGRDDVVVMRDVSWQSYEAMLEIRGEKPRPRMAYLDGTLELMSPGGPHELDKKLLARLVEAYADGAELSLNGKGSETFRRKLKKAGIEADECYWIGPITKYPQLAIEVVKTSGGVDRLEIYRRLGVREVWFWIKSQLQIFVLVDDHYVLREQSVALRGIDLEEITRLCDPANQDRQTEMIRTYRRSVRRRRK